MLKYLLFYFLPLLHYMDILLHSWQSLKLTFLGISYLLFARNNCGKMFFKEFQGLLVTKNFSVWRIKDSVHDFYDVNIPKKMIHHTYFFSWNEYYFIVTIAIANGKLNATEIIEYPKNWYELFVSFVGYTPTISARI